MKTLTYSLTNDLSQLHDELLGAFPDLRETLRVEGASSGARVKNPEYAAWLEALGARDPEADTPLPEPPEQYITLPADPEGTVHLTVPDAADEKAIAEVVKAHIPKERVPAPTLNEQMAAALEPLLKKDALTGADLAPLVALLKGA